MTSEEILRKESKNAKSSKENAKEELSLKKAREKENLEKQLWILHYKTSNDKRKESK